eukprot:TRINITY_DN9148_c0_g1_i1.p1 TRINITY_DN9148_c0_g1~~TRINITY_DN9148_c0_g1_i1.p1  ORF type:complete len:580 (+),score=102.24 TRINITY_DN9148_c0_g1_i1:78-1817(+)
MVAEDFMLSIFYASQTGTAEEIAKRLCAMAKAKHLPAEVASLGRYEKLSLLTRRVVVIIASTTGDGYSPENAENFYLYIQKKHPETLLDKMYFAVLALGDSNFTNFCSCGKLFDKRMEELGGHRFYPRVDADASKGLSRYVDPWIQGLWKALEGLKKDVFDVDHAVAEADENKEADSDIIPDSVCRIRVKFQSCKGLTDEQVFLNARNSGSAGHNLVDGSFCAAKVMTSSEAFKQKIHMEISTPTSSHFTPGDSIGLFCHNSDQDVSELIKCLDVDGDLKLVIEPSQGCDISTMRHALLGIKAGTSIRQAFKYHFHITGAVSLEVMKILCRSTTDPSQKQKLTDLCQNEDQFRKEITQSFLSLTDVLSRYPSCKPSLSSLLDVLPQLGPRYFSIASSPLVDSKKIDICFTWVQDMKPGKTMRKGVCTSFMKGIADQLIDGTISDHPVHFFLKSGGKFVYPNNPETPLLLIAAGTGVAPFRGFLQQREAHQSLMNKSGLTTHQPQRGSIWLFMGCMHPDWDELYKDEWMDAQSKGILEKRVVSFSRYGSCEDRIHTRLWAESDQVYDFIVNQGASIFVCG